MEIRPYDDGSEVALTIKVDAFGNIMIFINPNETKMISVKFRSHILCGEECKLPCDEYEKNPKADEYFCTLPEKKHDLENKYVKNDVLFLFCECSWCDESSSIERIDFYVFQAVSVTNHIRHSLNSTILVKSLV
ncbi:hypothetical protein TNCV_1511541 [Trichonephila clavipes]|nr:hypothetical protein TNCV_1511541 [Trichonephila clavipes]